VCTEEQDLHLLNRVACRFERCHRWGQLGLPKGKWGDRSVMVLVSERGKNETCVLARVCANPVPICRRALARADDQGHQTPLVVVAQYCMCQSEVSQSEQ